MILKNVLIKNMKGSHLNAGAHIAKAFSENGFETVGFDAKGHGKSEGE